MGYYLTYSLASTTSIAIVVGLYLLFTGQPFVPPFLLDTADKQDKERVSMLDDS
jgi:hypothetical protein